jgi:prepilin-type N-terminal cleavage/methylation domain-containing protein
MSALRRIRRRLAHEESGFTLIELLVVLVIIGILLAIAVPSYLGFKDRAEKKAAAANVRSAIPAAEAYYSDNGDYNFTAVADLKAIDAGISLTKVVGGANSYCLEDTQGNHTATVHGPGGTVLDDSQSGYAAC